MHNQIILATGGYDHTIKLWRAETKDCIKSMQHPDSVSTLHPNSITRNLFCIENKFLIPNFEFRIRSKSMH